MSASPGASGSVRLIADGTENKSFETKGPGPMSETERDEPFPGYRYDPAASVRSDRARAATRRAILDHGDGSLFDTEPQQIETAMTRTASEDGT